MFENCTFIERNAFRRDLSYLSEAESVDLLATVDAIGLQSG